MNGKDILLGMSFISDELVEEADSQSTQKATPWRKWLPLAACLCLIIGAAGLFSALMPGMNNAMQESAVFDNELAAGGQNSLMEAGQENGTGVIWNYASVKESFIYAAGGASFTYGDSLPEGTDSLQLYTEKTEFVLKRTGAITVDNTLYRPESWDSTWISGTEVQLFLADSGTLLARFVIPYNDTEYLLVTVVSSSLSEDHFLQAITKIIEEQGETP